MNRLVKFFKKRKKEKEYRAYIEEHRENVLKAYQEMLDCKYLDWLLSDDYIRQSLFLRALKHDDSKYSKEEFNAYRAYFYPLSKEEEEWAADGPFDQAWEHHFLVNDHHWQHRKNETNFTTETEIACLENIMDWLAMSYKFGSRPFEYYNAHKDEITLPEKQIQFMEKCIFEGIDKDYIEALSPISNNTTYTLKMDIGNYSFCIPVNEEDLIDYDISKE